MILIERSQFQIINNKVVGSAVYTISSDFPSFWFNKSIQAIISVRGTNGAFISIREVFGMNFTQTERDETINFDEFADGHTEVDVQLFAWVSLQDPRPFTTSQPFRVTGELPPPPPKPSGKVVQIIKGAFFGSLALALLGSKGR